MGNRKGTKKAVTPGLLNGLNGAAHARVEGRDQTGRPRLVRLFYPGDLYDVTDDMVDISPDEKKSDDFEIPVEGEGGGL